MHPQRRPHTAIVLAVDVRRHAPLTVLLRDEHATTFMRVAVHLAVAVSTASAASAACLRFQLSVMHCAWLLISADRDRITVGIVSEFFISASLDLFFLFHDSILAHLRCASTSPK